MVGVGPTRLSMFDICENILLFSMFLATFVKDRYRSVYIRGLSVIQGANLEH